MKTIWGRLSLTGKILSIIVLTTVLTTVTIIPAIFFSIRDGMVRQQRDQLTGVRNLVEGLLDENRQAIRNYAVLFSTDREVRDNLFYHTELAGEREHPLNAIEHLADAFDVGYIEICDRRGRVVANTSHPFMYDVDRASDRLIQGALAGNAAEGIRKTPDGFLLTGVAPVYYDPDQLIGTLATGVVMNEDFVRNLKNLSRSELAVVDRTGEVIASTLDGFERWTGFPESSDTLLFEKDRFLLTRMPLEDEGDPRLGELFVMTRDELPAIIRRVHLTVSSILGVIALFSMAATTWIVRRLLAPVGALKDGAQQIGRGDFSRRVPVTSRDEIGSLAEVFNQMAADLEHLREMETRLRHSDRLASIGRFTAGIAHELNNPIANMIGLLKLIRRDVPDGEPVSEDLDIVIQEATRCGAIVRDLLLYSRPTPGERAPVDVNRLLRQTVAAMEKTMMDRSLRFELELEPALPEAMLNRLQIEQAVRNLLLNAAQASPAESTVSIGTAKNGDGGFRIRVADPGSGIRPEDLDKIFYPFFTTKKTGEGTGLGLAVTYGIVQSHGGEITVRSELGAGTTFEITLPFQHDER